MKKNLIILTILSLFVFSTCLSSQAISNNKGIISVTSSSEKELAPDTVEISFTVKTFDIKSIQQASLENKIISDKVYAQLKSMICPENGDYIKTSDYSAQPIYSYQNSKKIFEKYEVSNRVTINTKSINKIGEIIDKAVETGATNVDNLSFTLSNYENECNELIITATQKARTKAEIIAQTLNTKIKGVNNLVTSCNTNNHNTPRLYMAKNMISDIATESSTISTTISNGVIKINANVNASFFVK